MLLPTAVMPLRIVSSGTRFATRPFSSKATHTFPMFCTSGGIASSAPAWVGVQP
jgi:hypothetical protein